MKHYYYNKNHEKLPHIVKFSGGRSSGFMLLKMLESDMLNKERGDLVLFNNTSAEHSKTYEFVIKCKQICEQEYQIPFFILEFTTYEDSKNGIYDRFSSYRLVNDKPYSVENQFGYHFNGEIFEELVSYKGFLPSLYSGRICTKELKMETSKHFIEQWLRGNDIIPRLGHFGEESRISKDEIYYKHKSNNGETPKEIYLDKKAFCFNRELSKPEQKYQDFSAVDLSYRKFLKSKEYVTFIGFRVDEPLRIKKMKERINQPFNDNIDLGKMAYLKEDNEHIYMPMIQFGITKDDVQNFWQIQDFDLGLPYDGSLGNCVFCFMKGIKKLATIPSNDKSTGPENIDWWINIEKKYQRDLIKEKRIISNKKRKPYINFFGMGADVSYEKIKNNENLYDEKLTLPCHCSD